MVCCYECGMEFKSRLKQGKIQAYDENEHVWSDACPNCGCPGFDEDDYYEDPDEDVYDDEYMP